MMRLAELIARFEPELLARCGPQLLPSQRQALAALKTCRTRFAPHMLAACSGCHTQACLPHSCGHRACPHCQHSQSEVWLQRQLQALVPATYFLVTFTLPAQLRALAWAHQRVVYEALMRCAWDTLKTFSQNDKQLSGTPGALAVLHTHNRQLGFHPHVHVCLPAAAFDASERLWRTKVKLGQTPSSAQAARGGYLFSHKALGKVFAAKFQAALSQAGLSLPAGLPERWVVDCKAVGDGQAALRYLGRYLYRGVISERDILRCQDGQVTFRYRDAQSGQSATRTLNGADFLRLLLQHILPKGFVRARNFGFLHHNCRRTLHLLQVLHLRSAAASAVPPTATTSPTRPVWRCACGGAMVILRRRMRPESVPPCAAPQTERPDKAGPVEASTH